MGFADIMLGAKPKYELLPGMQDSIKGIQAFDPGLGYAGKSAKRTLKALNRGDDVSSMGEFAEIGQNEAKDLGEVDFDYMTGANALVSNAGGEDMTQINRMRDLAKERVREGAGRQRVSALGDLRRSATDTFSNARSERMANERWREEALLRARANVFNNTRSGGILNNLIQGAATLGSAAITKCWIAAAVFNGWDDPRVDLVRRWLFEEFAKSRIGKRLTDLYLRFGERVAERIKTNRALRFVFKGIFDAALRQAKAFYGE